MSLQAFLCSSVLGKCYNTFYLFSFFLGYTLLEYSCFIMCQFLLYSKMNRPYIYPLPFGFPSHSGHHRALSRVPCAIQKVLISYLLYTQYQQCICANSQALYVHQMVTSVLGGRYYYNQYYLCGKKLMQRDYRTFQCYLVRSRAGL